MGGGICPQEVGVIMGPLKRGKTTVVANFTKGALLKGYNVIHYLFEGNRPMTLELYDAMISGIPKEELEDIEKEVRQAWKNFFEGAGVGLLYLSGVGVTVGVTVGVGLIQSLLHKELSVYK